MKSQKLAVPLFALLALGHCLAFIDRNLPAVLRPHQQKLYGLTIRPERLQQIRNERRPNSRYASPAQVQFELREAQAQRKAAEIGRLVQGTMGLEAQGVSQQKLDQLVRQKTHKLLAGSRRKLWE